MKSLIRLYPRVWRDRYGDEVTELLGTRRMSAADALDLVRGAVDAHVHPQAEAPAIPFTYRLPGLAVLAAGVLWIGALATVRPDEESSVSGALLGFAMMAMVVGLPGQYVMALKRQILGIAAVGVSGVVLANLLPWPASGYLLVATFIFGMAAFLALAAVRAELSSAVRWWLVGATVGAPFAVGSAVVTSGTDVSAAGGFALLLLLPYGIAWALLGIRLAIRGSQSIVDPPTETIPLSATGSRA